MKKYSKNSLSRPWTWASFLLVGMIIWGCNSKHSPAEDLIVRYKDRQLYRAEIDAYVPDNLTPEDSARWADKYIDQWLTSMVTAEQARRVIPDWSDQIEYKQRNYESQLLRHAYADYLVRNQLYTRITEDEIRLYYQQYAERFRSKATYYSYFFMKKSGTFPPEVHSGIRSDDRARINEVKQWCLEQEGVICKLDSSYVTDMEMDLLEEESPYNLRRLNTNRTYSYRSKLDSSVHVKFKLHNTIQPGDLKPLDMCREDIERIILNQRKLKLIEQRESELVQAARNNRQVQEFK